jgi:S-(hydroxymethyl)glutathione dehydrogenase/alcohol dehydrogenase
MIRLAQEGAIDLDGQVTEVYPLERFADAVAATRSGRVIRTVLDFTA